MTEHEIIENLSDDEIESRARRVITARHGWSGPEGRLLHLVLLRWKVARIQRGEYEEILDADGDLGDFAEPEAPVGSSGKPRYATPPAELAGQWVAWSGGEVVASAESLSQVIRQVRSDGGLRGASFERLPGLARNR